MFVFAGCGSAHFKLSTWEAESGGPLPFSMAVLYTEWILGNLGIHKETQTKPNQNKLTDKQPKTKPNQTKK